MKEFLVNLRLEKNELNKLVENGSKYVVIITILSLFGSQMVRIFLNLPKFEIETFEKLSFRLFLKLTFTLFAFKATKNVKIKHISASTRH